MFIPRSKEQVKAQECEERQEEMDAIAGFGTRRDFPSVSGVFAMLPPTGAGSEEETVAVKAVNPSH